jgi:uncharacterized protein YkwD
VRSVRTFVVCSLVVVAAAVLPTAPAVAASPAQKATFVINVTRAKHGLRPLRVSPSLRRSARRYARRMLRHDYFGHGSRISASRRFRRLGETLGLNWGWRARWRRIVRAWMRSPSHRRILLSRRYTWVGVGFARGRMGRTPASTWVAHFGKR